MSIVNTARTVRQEVTNYWNDLKSHYPTQLDDRETVILNEIRNRGFHVIPDFYSNDQCANLRAEIERLAEKYKSELIADKEGSDHCIFGADHVSEMIGKFYSDSFINKIVRAHEKTDSIAGLTLAAKMEFKPGNKGSGGGWHRDWAVNKQIKAMVYLSDVSEINGPFQYLEGSQKHWNVIRDCFIERLDFNQTRFADSEVGRLIAKKYPSKLHTLTGKAGTLVLVNTRGIHRGMPIQNGVRYALTNYYWSNMPIPEHVAKLMVK